MINKKTSIKISYVNLISTVLIVLLHSNRYKYFPETPEYERFFLDYGSMLLIGIAMGTFFALTGFLLFKDIHADALDKGLLNWYSTEMKKRIKSLLVPYLVWNFIWTVFVVVITYIPFITSRMDSFQLYDGAILSLLQGVFWNKYNGVFWYVKSIIFLSLLSPVIYLSLRNRFVGGICLLLSMLLMTELSGALVSAKSAFLSYTANHLFFFLVGAYISIHHFQLINKEYKKSFIILGGIMHMSAAGVLCWFDMAGVSVFFLIVSLLKILRFAGFWIFADVFRNVKAAKLARISFFIYAMHRYVEQTANKLFELFLPHIPFAATINTLGGVVLTIVVIAGIAAVLSKYFPVLFFILNGGRNNKNFKTT